MLGAALVAKTRLVVPGVGTELRHELPRSLSNDGLTSCIEGPSPSAAMGHGNSGSKSTLSITLFCGSRKVISSPLLLMPPLHGPSAATPNRIWIVGGSSAISRNPPAGMLVLAGMK